MRERVRQPWQQPSDICMLIRGDLVKEVDENGSPVGPALMILHQNTHEKGKRTIVDSIGVVKVGSAIRINDHQLSESLIIEPFSDLRPESKVVKVGVIAGTDLQDIVRYSNPELIPH